MFKYFTLRAYVV